MSFPENEQKNNYFLKPITELIGSIINSVIGFIIPKIIKSKINPIIIQEQKCSLNSQKQKINNKFLQLKNELTKTSIPDKNVLGKRLVNIFEIKEKNEINYKKNSNEKEGNKQINLILNSHSDSKSITEENNLKSDVNTLENIFAVNSFNKIKKKRSERENLRILKNLEENNVEKNNLKKSIHEKNSEIINEKPENFSNLQPKEITFKIIDNSKNFEPDQNNESFQKYFPSKINDQSNVSNKNDNKENILNFINNTEFNDVKEDKLNEKIIENDKKITNNSNNEIIKKEEKNLININLDLNEKLIDDSKEITVIKPNENKENLVFNEKLDDIFQENNNNQIKINKEEEKIEISQTKNNNIILGSSSSLSIELADGNTNINTNSINDKQNELDNDNHKNNDKPLLRSFSFSKLNKLEDINSKNKNITQSEFIPSQRSINPFVQFPSKLLLLSDILRRIMDKDKEKDNMMISHQQKIEENNIQNSNNINLFNNSNNNLSIYNNENLNKTNIFDSYPSYSNYKNKNLLRNYSNDYDIPNKKVSYSQADFNYNTQNISINNQFQHNNPNSNFNNDRTQFEYNQELKIHLQSSENLMIVNKKENSINNHQIPKFKNHQINESIINIQNKNLMNNDDIITNESPQKLGDFNYLFIKNKFKNPKIITVNQLNDIFKENKNSLIDQNFVITSCNLDKNSNSELLMKNI